VRIGSVVVSVLAAVVMAVLAGCGGVAGAADATGGALASPTPSVSATATRSPSTISPTPALSATASPPASPAPGPSQGDTQPPDASAPAEDGHPSTRTFLVRDWQRIDATMDNTGSIAAENGEEALADQAHRVREEGWRALHEHPQAGLGRAGWPPDDAELTVHLDAPTWAFVCTELRRWAEVERMALADSRTTARHRRDLRESLRWSDAMLAELESGSSTPRTDP
jgi:hypothetical protein